MQTTWLGITGRKEICREIVIDKLQLLQQPPNNLKEHQLEPEEIPEEDLDEDAVEPTVDPQESRDRINHILCKDDILHLEDLEEEAIYEEKAGDWGTGMTLGDPRPPIQDEDAEGQTGAHTEIRGGGGPTMPGEEPEEASEAGRPLQLETENEGRTHQNTKGDTGQGASQAQAVELPQEETEAFQPEVSADARPLTEEGPGEMYI